MIWVIDPATAPNSTLGDFWHAFLVFLAMWLAGKANGNGGSNTSK